MGSDEPKKSTSQADSKFQFYNSESGEVLGRTWDSWGKIDFHLFVKQIVICFILKVKSLFSMLSTSRSWLGYL